MAVFSRFSRGRITIINGHGGNVNAKERLDCFQKNSELLISDYLPGDVVMSLEMTIKSVHPIFIVWVQMVEEVIINDWVLLSGQVKGTFNFVEFMNDII